MRAEAARGPARVGRQRLVELEQRAKLVRLKGAAGLNSRLKTPVERSLRSHATLRALQRCSSGTRRQAK